MSRSEDRVPQMAAGRVVMAVADDDLDEVKRILIEHCPDAQSYLNLLADVAGMASECIKIFAGDDWRSYLGGLLNVLEAEQAMEKGASHG